MRGDINSFLDNLGDSIAGRKPYQRPQTVTDGGQRPEDVSTKGQAELDKGLAGFERRQ